MSPRIMIVWLACVALALTAGGCGGMSHDLAVQSTPPIADVPMPQGFALDESVSRNDDAGGRCVDHTYRGWSDKFAVQRFCKSVMPANQWALAREMFSNGQFLMEFDKGSERCLIIIDQPTMQRTCVRVWLSAVGRNDGKLMPVSSK